MRSEQDIYTLILDVARKDENIRLVILNGSRANPLAKKDIFQDYDIVYYVTEITPYQNNMDFVNSFGEIMILQIPEEMDTPPPENDSSYGYLMQFMDGSRIDLSIRPLKQHTQYLNTEHLTKVLLDKDGLADEIAPPSDIDFHPKPPTQKQFEDCCNEFWWLSPYVAKGLWRGELIYPKFFLDGLMRTE
jgi:aminoglycoside 6-adenylyltransferase